MKTMPIVCLIIEASPFQDLGEGQRGYEAEKGPDKGDVQEKPLVVKEAEQGQHADDEDPQNIHGHDPVGRRWAVNNAEEDKEGAEETDVDQLDQKRPLEDKEIQAGKA